MKEEKKWESGVWGGNSEQFSSRRAFLRFHPLQTNIEKNDEVHPSPP